MSLLNRQQEVDGTLHDTVVPNVMPALLGMWLVRVRELSTKFYEQHWCHKHEHTTINKKAGKCVFWLTVLLCLVHHQMTGMWKCGLIHCISIAKELWSVNRFSNTSKTRKTMFWFCSSKLQSCNEILRVLSSKSISYLHSLQVCVLPKKSTNSKL